MKLPQHGESVNINGLCHNIQFHLKTLAATERGGVLVVAVPRISGHKTIFIRCIPNHRQPMGVITMVIAIHSPNLTPKYCGR